MAPKSPRTPKGTPKGTPRRTPAKSPKTSAKSPAKPKQGDAVVSTKTALLCMIFPNTIFSLLMIIFPREFYMLYDSTGSAGIAQFTASEQGHVSFVIQGWGLAVLGFVLSAGAAMRSKSANAAHNVCFGSVLFHVVYIPFFYLYARPKYAALKFPESGMWTNLTIFGTQLVMSTLALNGHYGLKQGPRAKDYLDVPLMLWAVRACIVLVLFCGLLFVMKGDGVLDLFVTADVKQKMPAKALAHMGAHIPVIGFAYIGHALSVAMAALSYDLHAIFCQCSALMVYSAMSFAMNCAEKTAYDQLGFPTEGILFTALMLASFCLLATLGVSTAGVGSRVPTFDKAHIA